LVINAPTDRLLLEIGDSYFALEEFDMARAYLQHCIEISNNSQVIVSARILLSIIFRRTGDFNEAEKQLLLIMEEAGENAEARYLLGELYALQGDTARARAEWRLALRADPAHSRARSRLSL